MSAGYTGNFRNKGISGQDVTAYGALADGSTDDHAAFEDAITAAASVGGVVIAPKVGANAYKIEDDFTVPAGVTIYFEEGAFLSVDTAKTVTVNGHLIAGLSKIMSGAGTLALAAGSVKEVVPQWWGALGDNSNDDTAEIQAAITAAGTIPVFLPTGVYKTTSAVSITAIGATLTGAGWLGSQIRVYGGGNCVEVDARFVTVSHLRVTADTAGSGSGILITQQRRCLIDQVFVGALLEGATLYFDKGIEITGEPAYNNTIHRCHLEKNNYNIYLTSGTGVGPNETHIIDCIIMHGNYGIYIGVGDEMRIWGNRLEFYLTRGIYVNGRGTTILNNRLETSEVAPIELAAGVVESHIAKNWHTYLGTKYVVDNSGSVYNYIENYQMLFWYPGSKAALADTQGGNITLAYSSGPAELKMESLTGDLQFEASGSGDIIDLQSDTEVAADKSLVMRSPLLRTPNGGFGPKAENTLFYSEDWSNAKWVRTNCTQAANDATAPNDYDTATLLTATVNSGSAYQWLNDEQSIASGKRVTVTVWLRADTPPTTTQMLLYRNGNVAGSVQDVTVTTAWKRYKTSGVLGSTGTVYFLIYPAETSTGAIHAWGAQCVIDGDDAFYPYIKTTDTLIDVDTPALVAADGFAAGGTGHFFGLDASRLISSDASKMLESSDATAWIAGAANDVTVTDDADGTVTLSTVTLGDIVAGAGLTGGADNVLPGADADVTLQIGGATTRHSDTIDNFDAAEAFGVDITGIATNNPVVRKVEVYIYNDPTADENINCRLSFYNSDSMTEDELIIDFYFNLTYTEINNGAGYGSTDTAITVDDSSGITKYDLVRFLDGTPENQRNTATPPDATTFTVTALVDSHADNSGVVKVAEITTMFQLVDADASNEIHVKLEFLDAPTADTDVAINIDVQ